MTRQMALEYAEDNIRVLAVNPGAIETPLLIESLDTAGENKAEARRQLSAAHPLGRVGLPSEIASVVVFMASGKASFMTGEYVCVDGGLMAKGAWA